MKKTISKGDTVRVIDDVFPRTMVNRTGVVVKNLDGGYEVRFQGSLPDDPHTKGNIRIFLDDEIELVPGINDLLKKYYDIR